MTPRTLFAVARRRIYVVIACAVLVPATALGWSLGQTKEYTATAQLLFRDPGFDQKLFGSTLAEPSQDPQRQAATNVLLVSNRRVAERTARAYGRGLTSGAVVSKREVTAEGQADVISLSITDASPIQAARLANTYATEFINFRRDADRAKITETQALIARQRDALPPSALGTPNGQSLRRQAEQLRILASLQTGKAELVQSAAPPGSPSSPRTFRNVLLGGLVGLLMGLGIAVLLERLDRRLRDPREIETGFGRPILGTVPESRGLDRSVPSPNGSLGRSESESFSMIRANLRYFNVGRPVKSILVTSAAPGDGKTTIAWNLARAAAAAGDRVLMIEADLRHPSILTAHQSRPGLGALLAGNADMADVVTQLPVETGRPGGELTRQMDVITAGAVPPNPIDLLESDAMRELIADTEERYDLILIDSAPTAVVSDAIPLIKQVSGVIVVTRLNQSTRTAMQQLRRQLENLDAPTLGIVVNSMRSAASGYGYGYGYGYGSESEADPIVVENGQHPADRPDRRTEAAKSGDSR